MQRIRTIAQWAAICTGSLGMFVLAFAHNASVAYTLTLLIGLGAMGSIASRKE